MPHFDVAPLPGYSEDYGLLLATLLDSTREWRDELGEPGVDTIVWQPCSGGYSIGGQLLHIAEVELYWIESFCLGRELDPEEMKLLMSDQIDQHRGIWPVPPAEPIAYYYGLLDNVRTRTLESVKEFEPSETVKTSRWGTMTLRWVLAHVVEHDSYHGGQAVMLSELAKRLRRP